MGRVENSLSLFAAATDRDDLAAIRDCTHKGWALGGERFRAEIEALGRRQAASKGVGRPRTRETIVPPFFAVDDLAVMPGKSNLTIADSIVNKE